MHEDLIGERVDQYELTELVARSGMASIFKAKDTESGATVVLKIPHIQLESDVVFFERFKREQEIGQRLDHPAIVKVVTPREQSRTYIALEYIAGKSLRVLLDEARPMPTAQALAIAIQVGEALAYMHGKGVVHRDLKPENIIVTPEGQVKILDFGIALDEAARRITWYGLSSTIGTPDYMAPEQIAGRRGDERTDIYALGTMLYELLTGHLPFEESNPHALMRAKTTDQPRAPSYFVPGIDPSLETIILRAIQPRSRDRYGDVRELVTDLKNPSAVAPRSFEGGRAHGIASRPVVMALIIGAILIGLGLLMFVTSRGAPPPHPSTATPRAR